MWASNPWGSVALPIEIPLKPRYKGAERVNVAGANSGGVESRVTLERLVRVFEEMC